MDMYGVGFGQVTSQLYPALAARLFKSIKVPSTTTRSLPTFALARYYPLGNADDLTSS